MSKVVFGKGCVSYSVHWQHFAECNVGFFCFFLVGNVPYNMNEESLIEIFKRVGTVVGFRYVNISRLEPLNLDPSSACLGLVSRKMTNIARRLVFDRETGKPRGYGFCEFAGVLFYFIIVPLYHTERKPFFFSTSFILDFSMSDLWRSNPNFMNQLRSFVQSNPNFMNQQRPFVSCTDHETALSAVRNLNNVDCGGRPLRIDLADSDPFLEGKTTVRGELVDNSGSSK